MASAAYLTELAKVSREVTHLVRITVAGTVAGSTIFKFSPRDGNLINLQLNDDIRPYMKSFTGRPSRIRPEKSITEQTNFSITFFDDLNPPPFDSAVFTVTTGGTFWQRLLIAQPDIIGSKVEILRGFKADGFLESDFEVIFSGRFEDYKYGSGREITIKSKDLQVLTNTETPSEITDTNLIDGAILATDSTFDVDDAAEITDPDSLGSKDQMPIVIRLDPDDVDEEDVIIKGISSNTVSVQDNHLERSEDFANATWVKTSGTTAKGSFTVGPFAVDINASQIIFNAVADEISQDPTVPSMSNETWVFSIWLRSAVGGTITLEVDEDGGDNFTSQVTLTDIWTRFQLVAAFTGAAASAVHIILKRDTGDLIDVEAYGAQFEESANRGFYVATTDLASSGVDAGRGAFGTTGEAHGDDDLFTEVAIYRQHLTEEGIGPIVILRDLISRTGIGDSDLDLAVFSSEFDADSGKAFRRGRATAVVDTTIVEPRTIRELVTEVRKQSLIDVWISEQGKYKAKAPLTIRPGESIDLFTDEASIVFKSSDQEGNTKERVTRAILYYDKKAAANGDKPEDFEQVRINVDLGVEDLSGPNVKVIFSDWIYRASEASQVTEGLVSRFRRGAERLRISCEIKDDFDIVVGNVIALNTEDVLTESSDGSISRGNTFWQVTQKIPKKATGQISIELVLISKKHICFISPAIPPSGSFPEDFDDATEEQKIFGFIGTAGGNKLGDNAVDGCVIF